MFTLEYLKEHSKVSTNGEDGSLYRGTLDFLRTYFPQIMFEETSQIPEGQPEELRPFWLAYERAKKALKKEETISVDDFYAEWSKNPADFAPVKNPVIGDLKSILDKYQDRSKKTNVTLYNYDGLCSWTHGHEDFVEALKGLGNITCDVTDVIEFEAPVLKKTILKSLRNAMTMIFLDVWPSAPTAVWPTAYFQTRLNNKRTGKLTKP